MQPYGKRYRPFRAEGNRRDIHDGIGLKPYANGFSSLALNP